MCNNEITTYIEANHENKTRQKLADELGLTIGQVKGKIERMGLMGNKRGAKKKPFMERKVQFSVSVKRKYLKEVQDKTYELIKNYR